MRAFLAAFAAVIVISVTASVVLERFQKGSDVSNTTPGAGLNLEEEGIKSRGW